MPPRKRKAVEVDAPAAKAAAAPRRSPRLANEAPEFPLQEPPVRKKRKTTAESKPEKKDGAGSSKEEAKDGDAEEENEAAGEENEAAGDGNARTFVIEHCKTGGLFKTRADEAKAGLEIAIPGVNVLLNPAEPRKGCFEIREQDGEIFISLLDMKRPYKALKDLDMEEVIANIIEKINA